MAIDNVVASLLRIPLFAGLKPLQITEIARQAEHHAFRRGDVITKAGMPGDGAYLILSGDAECRPDSRSREPVEPGSLVGELAMLVEHIYGSTVAANSRVQCLKLARTTLHSQMRADPDLAERLGRVITERLALIAFELREIDQLLAGHAGYAGRARAQGKPPVMLSHLARARP